MKTGFKKNKIQKILFLLCFIAFGLTSCVKQSGCEDCVEGTLINLEKPIDGIYAYFIPDSSALKISITSKIPLKLQDKDTLKVCVNFKKKDGAVIALYSSFLDKLICIEKVDN